MNNKPDPKFTSMKMNIMKSVSVAPQVPRTIDYVKEALSLEPSILFDIPDITHTEIKFKINMFDYLPFDDIMFIADVVTHEGKNNGQDITRTEKAGWLIRIKRKSKDVIRLYQYMLSSKKEYVLVVVLEVEYRHTFEMKYIFKPTMRVEELNDFTIPLIVKTVGFLATYTPIVMDYPPTSSSFRKKVKPTDVDKYIVYTLNKTKPIKRSGVHLGGTHASPIEHERIGHWSTSKTGKRYFVRASTVNKGKGGRVEKDYQL